MRLVGSRLEATYRESLTAGSRFLRDSDKGKRILNGLTDIYSEIKTAYILSCIPDQGEDFYVILLNENILIRVEVDRLEENADLVIEQLDFKNYKNRLTKTDQIQLLVALELAQSEP